MIKINIQSCDKGHYYDGDRFSECPYCERERMPGPSMEFLLKEDDDVVFDFSEPERKRGPGSAEGM